MDQIILKKRDGSEIKLMSLKPLCFLTQAVQDHTLMGSDTIKLTVKSEELLKFEIGDKIQIVNDEYHIRTTAIREIVSDDNYIYEVTLHGVMFELIKSLYRDTDATGKSSNSSFDLTYTLKEFVKVVINNVNRDYPGKWQFDSANCPETDPILMSFSKQNCLNALQTICKEFNQDFHITQSNGVRTIHVGRYGSIINPPGGNSHFEYGKGKGLYKLRENKVGDKSVISRLWIEGGTQNIKSNYRDYSERLQLPISRQNKKSHTLYDGTVIPAFSETIGISSEARRFIEDTELSNRLGGVVEDIEYYDQIYPQRTGEVTAKPTATEGDEGEIIPSNPLSFIDAEMFDLTAKDGGENTLYLIDGVSAKITFISGMLAGQQFEIEKYDHATKTFTIIEFTDSRGLKFPSDAFPIGVGDKYKLTDIVMPQSYIDEAEEDLWYAGYNDFLMRKQARVQYELTFDPMYFIEHLSDDVEMSLFKPGDYIPIKDERFDLEKNIRITNVKRNLLKDHDYVLTLSDTHTISIIAETVQDVLEHENVIVRNRLRDWTRARLAWRTTEELRNMIFDTDDFFDMENIRPLSVDTNMLTVGAKSQQFVLIDVILQANANGLANRFDASTGQLVHLTIDSDNVKTWNMSQISVTLSEITGYYVYAKCSKITNVGVWHITQQQLKAEDISDPDNYYFQVGIIGSLHESSTFRDFTTTYGFTRINGNTITTGRIITIDGECYLDLDGNKFRIGDASSSIDWNVTALKQVTLKNVKVLSQSGDISDLGSYRGMYNNTYTYYPGDEVSYYSGEFTSTYRQTHTAPTTGIVPTDGTYWVVIAQGSKGNPGDKGSIGDYFEYRYAKSGSSSTPPSLTAADVDPIGWTTTVPDTTALEYVWWIVAKKSGSGALLVNWSTPIRIKPLDGAPGAKGESPVLVYRGVYGSSTNYYGTANRVDAVKYNGQYYIARIDAGTITGVPPTDTTKWNTFGAEFESIATNLLLAEGANIGDWFMQGGKIVSTLSSSGNRISLDASMAQILVESTQSGGDWSLETGNSTIKINAAQGVVETRNSKGVAYMSASGIFANNPKTNALPSLSTRTHYGSIVGLGYGVNINNQWEFQGEQTIVAGVYGRSSNSGTASHYGGYFERLKAKGLFLDTVYIHDASGSYVYLEDTAAFVCGITNTGVTKPVYLPNNAYEGQIVIAKQMGQGAMKFWTRTGQDIYDDSSINTSYDCDEGYMLTFVFARYSIGGVNKQIWTVSKQRF